MLTVVKMLRTVLLAAVLLVPAACASGGDDGLGGRDESEESDERSAEETDEQTESAESDGSEDSVATTTPRPTEPTAATSAQAPPSTTTDAANPLAALELGQTGVTAVDDDGRWRVTAAVEVTNRADVHLQYVQVETVLLAADGSTIDEGFSTLSVIAPGSTTWAVPTFYPPEGSPQPTSIEATITGAQQVTTFLGSNGPIPVEDVSFSLVSVRPTLDVNEVLHLEGLFHSDTAARMTQVEYDCGMYTSGRLVGGAYGFINELPPGGDAGFDTTTGLATIDPLPDDIRCVAAPTASSAYESGATGSGLEVAAGFSYNPNGIDTREHDTLVGVTLTNPTPQAALDVSVYVDLFDADGNLMEVVAVLDSVYVLPGQTFYTGAWPVPSRDTAPPASAQPRVRVGQWGDPTAVDIAGDGPIDLTVLQFDITDTAYVMNLSEGEIVGTAINRSPQDVLSPRVACTLLRDGAPVGGNSWIIDDLPVGVPVSFDILTGYGGQIDHDEIGCTVFVTSLTTFG